jgi:membrane protease YdiL (CAAX protease family)
MTGRRPLAAELAAVAAVAAWNAAINRLVPSPAYVPANLAAAGLSALAARHRRVPAADLGLGRDRLGAGLRLGLAAAAPVAAAVAAAAAAPPTRRWFVDERGTTGGAGYALYHVAVRIPLGTAVTEEVLFRGTLLGLLLQRRSRARAAAVSSALFGCWHVLPTLDTLRLNAAGAAVRDDPARTAAAVAAAVAVTGAAGLGFSWLRFRSGSVVTPMVVHAALNGSAFAAARLVARPPQLRLGRLGGAPGVASSSRRKASFQPWTRLVKASGWAPRGASTARVSSSWAWVVAAKLSRAVWMSRALRSWVALARPMTSR